MVKPLPRPDTLVDRIRAIIAVRSLRTTPDRDRAEAGMSILNAYNGSAPRYDSHAHVKAQQISGFAYSARPRELTLEQFLAGITEDGSLDSSIYTAKMAAEEKIPGLKQPGILYAPKISYRDNTDQDLPYTLITSIPELEDALGETALGAEDSSLQAQQQAMHELLMRTYGIEISGVPKSTKRVVRAMEVPLPPYNPATPLSYKDLRAGEQYGD